MTWRLLLACCGLLAWPVAAADPAAPLLEERWESNARGWRTDTYSRLADGAYLIDARGEGGYYRWLDEPSNLRDFNLRVAMTKQRGNNTGPLYGVIFRVQDSWRNCYFFVVNGSGGYFFGKFRGGNPTVLKQGTVPVSAVPTTLAVQANGSLFGLSVNDQPLANVTDDSYPSGGRLGLCVEAPALVAFDDLLVTAPTTAAVGPGPRPVGTGPQVLFADDFTTNRGWSVDAYRVIEGGLYHLRNQGEAKSFLSWHPKTSTVRDARMRIDARLLAGDAGKALYGLLWRLHDGNRFYFFLIGEDGRYYAGLVNGDSTQVMRKGRQLNARGKGQPNALEVVAEGTRFRCSLNGVEACAFNDSTLAAGAVGVYVEQPGHVEFDNLEVTAPASEAPPVVGSGSGGQPWPVGPLVWQDPLQVNGTIGRWPEDAAHRFDGAGYQVAAPAEGSRTVIQAATLGRTDGVYQVNARPVRGDLQSHFGLVVRANQAMDQFYYLLVNAAGRYLVGKCSGGQFATLDAGPIANLRGGDAGNELQVTISGGVMRYGLNGQPLGKVAIDLPAGAVGFHVENGAVASFRDLRVHDVPQEMVP